MAPKLCSFVPCGLSAWAHGLCGGHLAQQKTGRPLSEIIRDPVRRFWARVDKSKDNGGCWLWQGALNWAGYGWVGFRGKRKAVHRVAYEISVGPIPTGLDIDHVRDRGCRFRNCVNPAHLEPVTRSINLRRGRGGEVIRARAKIITHCPRGHAYREHAYITKSGSRQCKICAVESTRRWRERNRRAA